MWEALNWVAWGVTAALVLWMLYDALVAVPRSYAEDVLLSSREGVDELFADASGGRKNG